MLVNYEVKILKYFQNNYAELDKKVEAKMCRAIKLRIDQLTASENFWIFLSTRIGNPHPLKGSLYGCYGITITHNYRLIVEPISKDISPEKLRQCDIVKVKGVVDYHGQKEQ